MRGTPLEGRITAFKLQVEAVFGFGSLIFALNVQDFLLRALAWAVFVFVAVQAVRTMRRAIRLAGRSDPPGSGFWG